MRFFEKQKVDEIGIIGVKLQKILIFFMILNVFAFFQWSFWSWLSGLSTMVILYTGFYGAYKRRERLIQFYFVVTVMLIVLTVVAVLLGLAIAGTHHNEDDDITPAFEVAPVNDSRVLDGSVPPVTPPLSQPKTNQPSSSPLMDLTAPKNISVSSPNITVAIGTSERSVNGGFVLVFVIVFVLSLVVFALKITSLVLASRMVKMLRERQAHNLAHPIGRKSVPQTETQPMYQQVMYIPVPIQPNMNNMNMMGMNNMNMGMNNISMNNMHSNGAPFTNVMYNPYVTPFQPQQSSAPRQDV